MAPVAPRKRSPSVREGGVIASDAVRHPFAPLPEAARTGLLELARELDPVALRWGR